MARLPKAPATTRAAGYDREATRLRLLKAAEECFNQYGVARASMDDVAAHAGVSRPTLYRYFKDRDTLIRQIVGVHSGQLVNRFTAFLDRYPTIEDKLVEGLLYLTQKGLKDQFLRSLAHSESLDRATRLLAMQGGEGHLFAATVWEPVLRKAMQAGDIRPDLDLNMAYYWLTTMNFVLFEWLDMDAGVQPYHREMVRQFVVPAFVTSADPSVRGTRR
jgi:AcrR family transcriptional regulator